MKDESELEREIACVLNRHSAENESDTPDFILAEYLKGCLEVWNKTIQSRDKWWGFKRWGSYINGDLLKSKTREANK